ncbi:hypothetical protein ACLOJK_028053 [Asimina triloba]
MLLPFIPHLLSLSMIFHMHWSAGISQQLQNQTSWSDSKIPALYVIGDSLADPGNNNHIRTLIKANFPPYGRDFNGQIPTGRFSNGKLITDFLVSALGIKELLPPYMDRKLRSQDLHTGVSFASAGAGYDNITSQIMSAIPAWKQLELLKECLQRVKEHVGENKGNVIVTDSLYAVILGSNDFLTTYFSTRFRRVHYNLPAYISLLVEAASSIVKVSKPHEKLPQSSHEIRHNIPPQIILKQPLYICHKHNLPAPPYCSFSRYGYGYHIRSGKDGQ